MAAIHSTLPIGRVMAFVALALLYSTLQIHQSLDQGQLGYPITYDDSSYFRDGVVLLHAVQDRGPYAFVLEWLKQAPHSPWSATSTFAGFALFGVVDWAPAAASALAISSLLALLACLTRDLRLHVALLLAVGLLSWPYFGHMLSDSRPDMAWGILVALFVAVVTGALGKPISRRRIVGAGVMLAAALLAKTSTFPVTLAIAFGVTGTSVLLRRHKAIAGADPASRSIVPMAAVLGLGVLLAVPHYAVAYRNIYDYISANVFGDRAHIWELQLSLKEHLLYHLTGTGGWAMMGTWFWLTVVTLTVFLFVIYRKRDHLAGAKAACYAVAFAIGLAAVTVPAHKSPHIGAVVPAICAMAWVAMTIYLARSDLAIPAERHLASALLIATVAVGLVTFRWHSMIRFGPANADRFVEIRDRHNHIDQVLDLLVARGLVAGKVYVVGTTLYLNAETLRYYALKRRLDGLAFVDDVFSADLSTTMAGIDDSDAVILFTPDNSEVLRTLPSGDVKFAEEIAKRVEGDARLRRVLTLGSRVGDGETRIYVKAPAFGMGADARGFGAIEGPYPQWNLPRVRWGLGPSSTFSIPGAQKSSRLLLEGQTPHKGQVLTVRVDGKEAARHEFAGTDAPEQVVVEMPDVGGRDRMVELAYSKWSAGTAADSRKMAILFRRIQID
jgi:hypothetical protein